MSSSHATDPTGRRLSLGGGLVLFLLIAGIVIGIQSSFSWMRRHSAEWTLATAERVVADSGLAEDVQAGFRAELARLSEAHDDGRVAYVHLFATVQRLVEGPLVAAATFLAASRTPGLAPEHAALYRRLAASAETHERPTEPMAALAKDLATGKPPAEAVEAATAVLALENLPPDVDLAVLDPVELFRQYVSGTLTGAPPEPLTPQ